ncbi:MAG: peptidase [Candidatus Atribacteria bacterium]|nr:MAG: peptidase [Candidatus Atribacteria bacterium]
MGRAKPVYPQLDDVLRKRIIDKVSETVRECYVFEEDARRMADALLAQKQDGVFDPLESIPELAAALSRALQEVKADLHLSIGAWLPPEDGADQAAEDSYQEWLAGMPRRNFEFRKLEVLLGNIGYLDLRAFCPASIAGETAVAAMQFLAHTDALIFDLRDNGGGDNLVQYLQSYLFSEPTHMVSQRYRPGDRLEQTWTYAYVPGPRFSDVPVYVLMSRSSFSAAEDFAYTLQKQGRVTVVGEQTRGGAHPIEFYRFPELCLEIMIPNACSEDPFTGGNWEDDGVIPDVTATADDALLVAHELALTTLLKSLVDDEAKKQVEWALDRVRCHREGLALEPSQLALYAGTYGSSIEVTHSEQSLHIAWDGRRNHTMTPMGEHRFEFDHGNQRARFVLEKDQVKELVYSTYEGHERTLPRRPEA